jgi:hypothetical protein
MKIGIVPFVLLLSSSALAQSFTPSYPPPPAPGYVYTLPYGGYPTYAAAATSAATAAGDIYCVQGSNTQNVQITKIGISAIATAATAVTVSIIVRSSAATGGTASAVSIESYDQNKPPATATATEYDAIPTPGTQIAVVRSANVAAGTRGGANEIGNILFRFEPSPLILRGTSQFACINVSAVGNGAQINVFHEHVETTIGFP